MAPSEEKEGDMLTAIKHRYSTHSGVEDLSKAEIAADVRYLLGKLYAPIGGLENHEMKLKLDALKAEVNRKEEEIRVKENYLMVKMEELKQKGGLR